MLRGISRSTALAVLGLIALAALSGCSLLASKKGEPPTPAAPVVLVPDKPHYAAPVSTLRFEVAPTTDVVGRVQVTVASKADTLPDIARRFNVGYEEIVRANPKVDPWLPGEGREIVVPTQFVLPNAPREGVVINLAAMRIYYYPDKVLKGRKVARGPDEKQVVYTHPIGIGKVGWRTPEGTTKIVGREKDPTWRPSAAVRKEHAQNDDPIPAVVGPGPDNPLGKYKFTLGWQSYLIHGTNKPYGVGLRSSHGCIRLYPEDIENFYRMIPVGTPVHVVNQPYLFGWQDGQLYLQALNVLEDDRRDWKNRQQKLLEKTLTPRILQQLKAQGETIDWELVSRIAHQPRGLPLSVSRGETSAEDLIAAAPRVENRIPEGSNWNGADDPARQQQGDVQQMVSEQEKNALAEGTVPRI
jgi:L,D-transpeptidase ErfK/SrfK